MMPSMRDSGLRRFSLLQHIIKQRTLLNRQVTMPSFKKFFERPHYEKVSTESQDTDSSSGLCRSDNVDIATSQPTHYLLCGISERLWILILLSSNLLSAVAIIVAATQLQSRSSDARQSIDNGAYTKHHLNNNIKKVTAYCECENIRSLQATYYQILTRPFHSTNIGPD